MKMYKTQEWSQRQLIREIEVDGFSDDSVWIKGTRRDRHGRFDNYFETFEEAQIFLIEKRAEEINDAWTQIKLKEKMIEKILNLTP